MLQLLRSRLGVWAVLLTALARPALAQTPSSEQCRRARHPAAPPKAPAAPVPDAAAPRLDAALRQVLGQVQAPARGTAELQAANPSLRFGQSRAGGPTVQVRITARDVNALLPQLAALGFEISSSVPALHFTEGMLPVAQLGRLDALVPQGLLGAAATLRPRRNGGLVTSQADYVLEAARARATQPRQITGTGVTVGILSDSFNYLNGAAADVASGDLPVVKVLSDDLDASDDPTDEGRGMAQLVYDLAPGASLAFSTASPSEATFAQHIRDLANPSKGNCQVIVDDIVYPTEPFFQDGVVAQAVTDVVSNSNVAYFSAAGNNGSQSYENRSPQFGAGPTGTGRYLNFDVTGAVTDIRQPFTIPDGDELALVLQWSDPFYTVGGVKTDLDMYLLALKGTAVDTVYRSTGRNILTSNPLEFIDYANSTATSGTTTFALVVRLRAGVVPSILKYVNFNDGAPVVATKYLTNSSTIIGHAAAAEASAVAAVGYYNQSVPESYTSRGGALPFLFSPTGAALPSGTTRQKPNLASVDGTNTTFFGGSDAEGDGFPNFFGTSAAAPHAAAVAALLRASEPGLTASQVYARLVASARLIGSSVTDPLTGPGLIDAFTSLYGPVVAVAPPVVEDLEKRALPTSWLVSGTGAARAQVSSQAPASGQESLILDAYPYVGTIYSLNEATLYLTGAATASNLTLSFRERKFVAETDEPMPTQFTGSSNTDGVALSVDGGSTWYRVVDLTGSNATTSFQTKTVSLSQFANANGLALGSDVRLKFQRYGRGGSTAPVAANAAGRDFDDIVVSATAAAPLTALYALSPEPAVGCPGLQVQYADTSLGRPTAWQWTFPGGSPATSTARNPLITYPTPGHYGVSLSVRNASGTAARADTGVVFVQSVRPPTATLTASATSICPGGSVTFGSTVGTATCGTISYAWSFPGGSPASSTAQNPGAVTYATAGSYVATLMVSNSAGSITLTSPVDVGGLAIPYAESFDASTNLPRNWQLVTPSNYPWAVVPGIVGRNGAASNALRAPFARDQVVGEYPSVYSAPLNLGSASTPRLRFDLAYAAYATVAGGATTNIDSLIVRVADACTGTVLGRVYAKGAQSTLPTQASVATDFVPTQSSWRQELVDLSAFAGRDVVLQFRGYNGFGNWLYIDNVTVGDNVLSLSSAAATVGLEAWPVPAPGGGALNVTLPAFAGTVRLRLLDAVGREVWRQQLTQAGASWQGTVPLPVASGLYNLLYQPEGGPAAARRIVVQ